MELRLKRIARKEKYTIGKLYVNGTYVCDTLEDRDRFFRGESKVAGETAIPCGRYEVSQNYYSPRFGSKSPYKEVCNGYVPRLMEVPFFAGVLIHCGNYADYETLYKRMAIPARKDLLPTNERIEVI